MINKKNHPKIQLKGWIKVEGKDCLVTQVYNGFAVSGACEVVTDPEKPVNKDVFWDGKNWKFSTRPTFINAAETSRLKEFTQLLQQK